MIINHVAVRCETEKEADRFFQEVLLVKRTRDFVVSADVTKTIFGVQKECKVLIYKNKDFHFEVFITENGEETRIRFYHICLEIIDREKLIERAKKHDIEITLVPRGERTLLFLRDYSGNIYEIK